MTSRPSFAAIAGTGQGVFDMLRSVVKPIVDGLRAAP